MKFFGLKIVMLLVFVYYCMFVIDFEFFCVWYLFVVDLLLILVCMKIKYKF